MSSLSPRRRFAVQITPAIRDARLRAGLSQPQVARASGLDLAQLSKVERGRAGLSLGTFLRLAETLNLTEVTDALAPYVERRCA